jgi:hypothetical protein
MLLTLLMTATGCAVPTETWHRPDSTELERRAAQRECEAEAAKVKAEPAPYGGKGVGLQPAELEARARETFTRCMQEGGYTLERR